MSKLSLEKNSDITSPFDPKKVDITTKQMILEVIFRRLRNKEIVLISDFQREANLWNKTKQSQLIESILLKLPLPAFYFDGSDDDKWLVVDGLQRLSTFQNYVIHQTYIHNKKERPFKLENLEYLTQLNGLSFDELPREYQRRIEEHEVTTYIINPGTPNNVKFNLFKRINTGGLMLSAQEIRHTLNQGVAADFLKELSDLKEFKQFKIPSKRMVDRDYINRFVAFYLNPPPQNYKPDLDVFLNESLEQLKNLSFEQRDVIKSEFQESLQVIRKIWGNNAFRKLGGLRINPLNKSIFETLTVVISKLSKKEKKMLLEKNFMLYSLSVQLFESDQEFNKAISASTGDRGKIIKRFETIQKLVQKVLNA